MKHTVSGALDGPDGSEMEIAEKKKANESIGIASLGIHMFHYGSKYV